MSGYSSLIQKRRCAAAGFDYYLHRPVHPVSIDLLLSFERNAIQEEFFSPKQKHIDIRHKFASSQLEYAGIMLDMVSSISDDATRKRCVQNAQRINERVKTFSGAAGLSPNELKALQTSLAQLDVRLIATRNLPTAQP